MFNYKIIFKKEFDFKTKKTIEIPYCFKCKEIVTLLGLLDKKRNTQYYCNKCKKIIKNKEKK